VSDQLTISGGRPSGRPRVSILALDLSLTSTGVCLNGECRVIASKRRGYDRLAEIKQEVARLSFGIDLVVAEDLPLGMRKGNAIVQMAGLHDVIGLWLYEHAITTVFINPSTLKKWATGVGSADKARMLDAAIRRFHLREGITNDDMVDAYLLWGMAREAYGGPIAKVPADRAALVHRLQWPRVGRRS
jgi:Holliday junction resolvasome RuvABC endonuclease subunit